MSDPPAPDHEIFHQFLAIGSCMHFSLRYRPIKNEKSSLCWNTLAAIF